MRDRANSTELRRKTLDLFRYLREVTDLRLRQTLDVKDWEQVIWLHELSGTDNCRTRLDHAGLDDWIQVDRPHPAPSHPPVPVQLHGWIDEDRLDDWHNPPELRQPPAPDSHDGTAHADRPDRRTRGRRRLS